MLTSALTRNAQTTVPLPVQTALRLREGDEITWYIVDGAVLLGRAVEEEGRFVQLIEDAREKGVYLLGGTDTADARDAARDRDFDVRQALRDKLHALRGLCEAMQLPFRVNGTILQIPYDLFLDDLENRLLGGMASLTLEADPEEGLTAQIITFPKPKRRAKPKKPKSTETIRAMPVRRELSPEEREERRIKREAMKAERLRQREDQLAFLRDQYGEDQAQAYAALMGWR
ncbi:AbrB/MazE/SpoVT family DNA-binding domain-containing protein [Acidithiobacillus sp.]